MGRSDRNPSIADSARPFRVEREGPALVLHRGLRSAVGAVFLLLWLAGWSFGCVMLAHEVATRPSLERTLFAVPFFAAWFAVAAVLVHMLTGSEELRLGPEGLTYRWRALVTLARRTVPLDQVRAVVAEPDAPGRRLRNGREPVPAVTIFTLGAPIHLGPGLAEAQRRSLAALIDATRAELAADRDATDPPALAKPNPGDGPLPMPEGSRLQLAREWDRLIVVRRRPFVPFAFASLTLVVLFWDGIVGFFLLEALTNPKGPSLFGLIVVPHAVIGARFLLGWIVMLLAPFSRRTWTFLPGEITRGWTVFGRGRTRTLDVERPSRIELRKAEPRRHRWALKMIRPLDDDSDGPAHAVALVGPNGADLLVLDALYEGEAHRLAAELEATFREDLHRLSAPVLPIPRGADPLYDRWLDDRTA